MRQHSLTVHDAPFASFASRPPRLLDRVRQALRARHYSRRTEESYVAWIWRYIVFHGKRHPIELGAPEVTRFLTWLAVDGRVAASTQNQALSVLLFLYREVLEVDLPWLGEIVRAKRPEHVPVVLARDEVRALLQRLDGLPRLMAYLLCGAGLRVLECCRLRVQDVDFATNQIVVRGGKGDKDRVTMLPAIVRANLAPHLQEVALSTTPTLPTAPARSSSRPRCGERIRPRPDSGSGSGCSPPRASTATDSPASCVATTCTNQSCNARSRLPRVTPGSPSAPAPTPCAIRSRRSCSRTATTSERFRSCSATAT
jgi:hypothetical protein